MEFYKISFLVFFAAVAGVYWSLRRHEWRMNWLLGASCLFYLTFSPWYLLLIVASTSGDYLIGLRLPGASPRRRLLLLWLGVGVNLGLLAFFKYSLFVLHNSAGLLSLFGLEWQPPAWRIVLPLGISFYTFEAISYLVDVYRGAPPIRSRRDYALYILFFPHLLAGPIVRSGDFRPQLLRPRRFSWLRTQAGIELFILGLFKKVIIGDNLAAVVDPVFAAPDGYASSGLWLGAVGYAVQIYADFSGYSDMAIGLAHLLGFKLPANFERPYLSASITEFWRRWHVSLSRWLRDYLFIPLGGSRGGKWATCRNLLITFALCGVWHGASWPCILWGLYNGVLLVIHRLTPVPRWAHARVLWPLWVACTFLVVLPGWVLLRSASLADAAVILRGMAVPTRGHSLPAQSAGLILLCAGVILGGNLLGMMVNVRRLRDRLPSPVVAGLLAGSICFYLLLVPIHSKGFIYFHF